MNNADLIRQQKRADYYSEELFTATQKLASEKRDHGTTRKYLILYRWVALLGWSLFVTAMLIQPASAASLGEAVAVFTGGYILLSIATVYGLCRLIRRAKRYDRG